MGALVNTVAINWKTWLVGKFATAITQVGWKVSNFSNSYDGIRWVFQVDQLEAFKMW